MAYSWLNFLISRRYSITIAGDPVPKKSRNHSIANTQNKSELGPCDDAGYNASDTPSKKNKSLNSERGGGPYIFIANYSSLLNPLLLNLCLRNQKACYCMTKSQKQGSFFLNNINKIISNPELCSSNNIHQILDKEINTDNSHKQDEAIEQSQNKNNIEPAQNAELSQSVEPSQNNDMEPARNIEPKTSINSQEESIQNKKFAKYIKDRQNSIEKAVQAIKAGKNLVLWASDELQKQEYNVINNCIAYEVLHEIQEQNIALPEIFLARINGIWGSSFSCHDKDDIPTFYGSLFKKLHLLLLGPFLKQRKIQVTFRHHVPKYSDFSSMEKFNNLIKNWFTANNQGALFVPNLCFLPNKHMPISMPETIKQASSPNIIAPKKLKIIKKTTQPQPEQYIDTFIPNIEEQKKLSQDIPLLAEIMPAVIRTPPLLTIQHALTRQGNIIDTATNTFSTRRALLGLAKALSSVLSELSATHNIGIALPIGISSMAAFLATFDCKPEENRLPTMLDYTLDSDDFEECIIMANIKYIITTKAFSNLILPPDTVPIYVEDISPTQITKGEVSSFMGFAGNTNIDLPAVMLFTKEMGIIKAFTLTHHNLMSCLGDIINLCVSAPINAQNFSLLSYLPTYTSLGLLNNIIMPLTCGVPVVTVPHTEDISQLTRIAENYNTNLFIGTSSILEQILRNALIYLPFRYAIVHSDSDMSYIYSHFPHICPDAILLQAYSVNESSSFISLNTRQQPNSIGKILPSLEYSINNEKLYIRGASVFSGYLDSDDPRSNLNGSSIHNDWFCLDSKFNQDEEEFLYNIKD